MIFLNFEIIVLEVDIEVVYNIILKIIYFVFFIIFLIGVMIWFEIDVLKGVMMVVVGIIILFLIDKVMFFEEVMKSVFDGMKLMLYVLVIVVMFFVLKNVND